MDHKPTHRLQQLAVTLLLATLAGCASQPPYAEGDTIIDSALQQEPTVAPPAEIQDALLPPININVPAVPTVAAEPRFDVRVRRVPARDFFLGLVEGTPHNMVVHPEVGGHISLDLKGVTVGEVMATVREVYGYDYQHTASGYLVLPNTMRSEIFQVNYLDVVRNGNSTMTAAATGVSDAGVNDGDTTDNTADTSFSSRNTSSVTTLTAADFWSGLSTTLRQIVGSGEGRSVSVNPQSGVVVVRAMPNELRDVARFIDAIQQSVQRQVIIEARVLEVELSDAFQSGINWAVLGSYDGTDLSAAQIGGGTFNGGAPVPPGTIDLTPSSPATVTGSALTSSSFGGMLALAAGNADFSAFIEMLKTQGDVHVLSSPRVSTVNNQKAVIKVGSDEFFVTDITSNTTTGTATSQNVSVELTPFFSGVSLDVTPQISADGSVILHVHPSVSQVLEQRKDISTTDSSMSVPLARSTVRESDSIIRAANGQLVVIGGLMQTTNREENSQVPLLGDIPVVGELFRHRNYSKVKSELVILLKPVVVDGAHTWQQQLERSGETIRSLSGSRP